MFKDLKSAGRYCHINRTAAALLAAPAAPIVLLKTRPETELAPSVAPGLNELGVMLPYTPLHHLLLKECGLPLVMTSGNLSEEPIAQSDSEALEKLGSIADYFILHNREIASRYDDSVMAVINNRSVVVRRARGLAPNPLELPYKSRSVLAAGPELKNTFCLTRGNYAFVRQHIGDMENPDTVEHFEQTVRLYRQLFRTEPQLLACDLHPDYLSTRWAQQEARRLTLPLIAVQHHHAHIVSCMVENQIKGPVIGVALDGSGYGADGQIWGGEFMTADYNSFPRRAQFQYLPLPGGELAIRRTSRLAAAYIYALLGENPLKAAPALGRTLNSDESEVISTMIERRLNTPLSSSCGRLFDAVSALLNICQESTYEGQAAVELEAAAAGHYSRTVYPYRISEQGELRIIEPAAMLAAILADMRNGLSAGEIAARFHNSLISIIMNIVQQLSAETGLKQVALSGGVFQNRRIFGSAVRELRARGLQPLVHRSLPANDGCIALGQAAAAEFMYQAP
jgi:hydrogenase maturation protein HypF